MHRIINSSARATLRISPRHRQAIQLVKTDRAIDQIFISPLLQHLLGCTLQETHCRIRSAWAEAYASNAQPLQFADGRQPLPNHDIYGKIKLLDKATYRTRLSQTHRIDAISSGVSVRNGAMNSLLELHLLVACSKS